jgi:hypothetical protein
MNNTQNRNPPLCCDDKLKAPWTSSQRFDKTSSQTMVSGVKDDMQNESSSMCRTVFIRQQQSPFVHGTEPSVAATWANCHFITTFTSPSGLVLASFSLLHFLLLLYSLPFP